LQLAIISDTHMAADSWPLPHRCFELIAASDLVMHAGDIMTSEALREIEAIGPPVRAVAGNMDGPSLRARLPETEEIEVGGAVIAMLHDAGPCAGVERMRRCFPRADAVVFGHTHSPLHERDGAFQMFNPGSPTDRRFAPSHSMGLASVKSGQISFELVELG
jgi:putative phosphoesterase